MDGLHAKMASVYLGLVRLSLTAVGIGIVAITVYTWATLLCSGVFVAAAFVTGVLFIVGCSCFFVPGCVGFYCVCKNKLSGFSMIGSTICLVPVLLLAVVTVYVGVYKKTITDLFTEYSTSILTEFQHYDSLSWKRHQLDYVQQTLHCCGLFSHKDYLPILGDVIPSSCINTANSSVCPQFGYIATSAVVGRIFTEGCFVKIHGIFGQLFRFACFGMVLLSVLLIFGFVIADGWKRTFTLLLNAAVHYLPLLLLIVALQHWILIRFLPICFQILALFWKFQLSDVYTELVLRSFLLELGVFAYFFKTYVIVKLCGFPHTLRKW